MKMMKYSKRLLKAYNKLLEKYDSELVCRVACDLSTECLFDDDNRGKSEFEMFCRGFDLAESVDVHQTAYYIIVDATAIIFVTTSKGGLSNLIKNLKEKIREESDE
jgi:hypothetical protein